MNGIVGARVATRYVASGSCPGADGIDSAVAVRGPNGGPTFSLISAAEFTSVPSLRFVPGSLVRTNPSTQAVVRRERAAHVDLDAIDGIGVWRIVIDDLLRNPWPDETVLAAASASRKAAEDAEGIRKLRLAGVAD